MHSPVARHFSSLIYTKIKKSLKIKGYKKRQDRDGV